MLTEELKIKPESIVEPFYIRYYAGHQGRFGHEFLGMYVFIKDLFVYTFIINMMNIEFDIRLGDDGKGAVIRYANNSNYRKDSLIRKECKQLHFISVFS